MSTEMITIVEMPTGLEAAEKIRQRANAMRPQLIAEEPLLLTGIEAFFAAALRWYFETLTTHKIRPWAPRQGPDREAFCAYFAAEWRLTWLRFLQHQVAEGRSEFDLVRDVGKDLWPKGLYQVPTIAVSDDFVLSASALHRIGANAHDVLLNGARFPDFAVRWFELLGYEIKNAT